MSSSFRAASAAAVTISAHRRAINGKPVRHAQRKPDTFGSMELTNLNERLQIMDEENIWLQVLYPTLFLAYPLSSNPAYTSAMC